MRTPWGTILTPLSQSIVIAAIALSAPLGCSDEPESTSLEGSITCGSMTCGDGQLCKTFEPHPNETLQYSCVTVETDCEVFDCVSDDRSCGSDCEICPACVSDHCGYLTTVEGRDMF